MICLDTSAIIDILMNKPRIVDFLNAHKDKVLCTTRINLFEVLVGIFLRKGPDKQKVAEAIRGIMGKIKIAELHEIGSIKAAEIKTNLIKEGREIETTDCLIAGIMISEGIKKILTSDNAHFERIKEIESVAY